jgi:hypothetical protein
VQRQIRYVPDNIVLDLSKPDLAHPDGLDILQRHYRQSERPSMGFNHANPAFICLRHEGGTNPGLFPKKINGEWYAVHYEPGICHRIRLPAPMSDEHKRQTEYWARAAQDVGWGVDLEYALPTGTRPDALIRGPVTTGVEVQRSAMTPGHAVTRTAKASGAGVTDVWYSDWTLPPKWAWRVPSVLSREHAMEANWESVDWKTVPPRRTVRAVGLRQIDAAKCTMTNFQRCPYGRNWCGRWHPKPVYWGGLSVDDVAAQFPAGKMVLLSFYGVRMPGSRDRKAVFIVPPAGRDLYIELTGWSGVSPFDPAAEDRPPREPSGAAECRNVQPSGLPSQYRGIWQIDPQTSMWCESCGSLHPIIEHRNCRAAASW